MTRQLTRAEVLEHNHNKDCWIVIGNKVYDVTKFLEEHPGGCEVLLEKAGEDRTEAFEDVGHSSDAREMKEDYFVGDIVEAEKQKYSYDEKPAQISTNTGASSENSLVDNLVYPGLVVIIALLLYYLFA